MTVVVNLKSQEQASKEDTYKKLHRNSNRVPQVLVVQNQRHQHRIDDQVLVEGLPVAHLDGRTEAATVRHQVI